ncbi:hypothetical protein [Metamycoplasma auris]|uniref:Uncharacterized protein n=1 Tax=Metamycoplasma auris TaxID=51363 RepID=A0A2W7FZY1_9BACT|nr:hypothetical protein [Metamycoplasma auris]PZV99871.1 hypothetical protein BCF89_10631 [Metamycoplasma auris]
MKKSLAFLLAATSVATITTPILTISCGDKESKEKKEFKEEITKLEAQIKTEGKLKAETKIALEKIASDAKLQLNKLKTPEDFKKATEELKKKIEEAKNEKNEGTPVTPPPSKPGDSTPPKKPGETTPGGSHSTTPKTPSPKKPDLKQVSAWNAAFNYSATGEDIGRNYSDYKTIKERNFWKNLDIEAIINEEIKEVPETKPSAAPTPPAEKPAEEDASLSEVDKIAKKSKDILILGKDAKDEIELLKKDDKKYTLWYDRNNKKIVMTEGKKPPFGRNFKGMKWDLFDLSEKVNEIGNEIQLINANNPTFEVQKGDRKFTNLSTRIDFKFDDKKENIILEYKIGKFIKGKDPEVSKEKNSSTIKI